VQVYWNGALILSENHTSPLTPYQAALELPNSGNQPFNGWIDEFRIWNVARIQKQIQSYMKRNLRGNETGLLGYWDFNEGTGTTVNDKSGHGFNGLMDSLPAWHASGIPLLPAVSDLA